MCIVCIHFLVWRVILCRCVWLEHATRQASGVIFPCSGCRTQDLILPLKGLSFAALYSSRTPATPHHNNPTMGAPTIAALAVLAIGAAFVVHGAVAAAPARQANARRLIAEHRDRRALGHIPAFDSTRLLPADAAARLTVAQPQLLSSYQDPNVYTGWGYPSVYALNLSAPESGPWRMLYGGFAFLADGDDADAAPPGSPQGYTKYLLSADSEDGIHWAPTKLPTPAPSGWPDNAVLRLGDLEVGIVYDDWHAIEPDDRLKAIVTNTSILVSADGLSWRPMTVTNGTTTTPVKWEKSPMDPGFGVFRRRPEYGGGIAITSRPPALRKNGRHAGIHIADSWADLGSADAHVNLPLDNLYAHTDQIYGLAAFEYPGPLAEAGDAPTAPLPFVGFAWRYQCVANAAGTCYSGGNVTADLAWSPTGDNWTAVGQPGTPTPAFPNVPNTNYSNQVYPSTLIVATSAAAAGGGGGEEQWLVHASAASVQHGTVAPHASNLLTFAYRPEGLAFWEVAAGKSETSVRTCALADTDTDAISLNVDAGTSGRVDVRLLDAALVAQAQSSPDSHGMDMAAFVIPGYDYDDGVAFSGDATAWTPEWTSNAARPPADVMVQIRLRGTARLYAVSGVTASSDAQAHNVAPPRDPVPATISVSGLSPAGETRDGYISFNLEFVPPSFAAMQAPKVRFLASQLAPSHLRMGGNSADLTVYQIPGGSQAACNESVKAPQGCLTTGELRDIVDFGRATGIDVIFDVNEYYSYPNPVANPTSARKPRPGPLNFTNAAELLAYMAQHGIDVPFMTFGNELANNVSPAISASDFATLRAAMDATWPDALKRPTLLGPDFWWKNVTWLGEWIDARATRPAPTGTSGSGGGGVGAASLPAGVEALTWHLYPMDCTPSVDLILDPSVLDVSATYAQSYVDVLRQKSLGDTELWITETGVGWGGNMTGLADAFVDGFWWLDQLGLLAKHGVTVQHRHALAGSWPPCLLDDASHDYDPRPDYWTSVLWGRVVGKRALNTSVVPKTGKNLLRAYAFCGAGGAAQDLVLVLINLSKEASYSIAVAGIGGGGSGVSGDLTSVRHDYWLSAVGGDIQASSIALNGVELVLSEHSDSGGVGYQMPSLAPKVVSGAATIDVAPLTYGFVRFPGATVSAC